MSGCSVAETFERMVDAVMGGRVLPFVGAGISMEARSPSRPAFEPKIGRGAYLWQRLRRRVVGEIWASRLRGEHLRMRLARRAFGLPGRPSFGTMAEVCEWLLGAHELCETLAVGQFSELEPRPAHYALACLALEGLVEEVISTNWDTCIETAMCRLTGGERNCRAIASLGSYRQFGSMRQGRDGTAVLRLYKINGCASEYRHDPVKNAESIVVTERQLQDFGNRGWARDLLRDRARSRTLLFSGFGSDEAQVRHTVLQLMDELSRDGGSGSAPEHDLFLVAYDHALSFNQQQILRAFVRAQGISGKRVEDEVRERYLSGEDCDHFGTKRNLPADDFWCALFEAAVHRLLSDPYTKPGYALYDWLALHSDRPREICASLLESLFPRASVEKRAFRCSVPGLFGPHPVERGFLLSRWLEVMGRRPLSHLGAAAQIPRYCALRDRREPLLPLATLVVLQLLARFLDDKGRISFAEVQARIEERPGAGLAVRGRDGQPGPGVLYLVTDKADDPGSEDTDQGATTARARYEIAVPASLARQSDSRFQVRVSERTRRVGRCFRIPAHALLGADSSRGWRSLAALFAAREEPQDQRRRRRLRRIEEDAGDRV